MLELLKYVNKRIDEVMEGIYETDEILRSDAFRIDHDAFEEADQKSLKLNGQLEELQKLRNEIQKKVGLK